MTPTGVARENDISQGVVSMWKKRGSTPSAATVARLANYFGVTVDYLMGVTDTPRPNSSGKTVTFQPFTKEDDELLKLGGFGALAEFYNLSEDAQAEALKDIKGFVEYTIQKYKKQDTEN